jgi:hypothetical protein
MRVRYVEIMANTDRKSITWSAEHSDFFSFYAVLVLKYLFLMHTGKLHNFNSAEPESFVTKYHYCIFFCHNSKLLNTTKTDTPSDNQADFGVVPGSTFCAVRVAGKSDFFATCSPHQSRCSRRCAATARRRFPLTDSSAPCRPWACRRENRACRHRRCTSERCFNDRNGRGRRVGAAGMAPCIRMAVGARSVRVGAGGVEGGGGAMRGPAGGGGCAGGAQAAAVSLALPLCHRPCLLPTSLCLFGTRDDGFDCSLRSPLPPTMRLHFPAYASLTSAVLKSQSQSLPPNPSALPSPPLLQYVQPV